MIEVQNLVLEKNGRRILDNVSFKTNKNLFAIIGANGAGKTSLAYCIMGIEKCSGSIKVDGEEINNLKVYERAKKGVTLAWQIPAEFEGMKVKDYLKASCRCLNLNENKKEELIARTIEKTGLNREYLNREISKLSGGERKRVELASVSLVKPRIIILDEPDSGIDLISFDKIIEFIMELSKESQVLIVTHSKKISSMTEEALLLKNGRAIKLGPTEEILKLYDEVKK